MKILVLDVLILLFGYFVAGDLQWRSSYAASEGLLPTYSYFPFIQLFTMSGRVMFGKALPLQSPPTLDWLQVLGAVFVVANLWYAYVTFRRRKSEDRSQ